MKSCSNSKRHFEVKFLEPPFEPSFGSSGGVLLLGGQTSDGIIRDEILHLSSLKNEWISTGLLLEKPRRSLVALALGKYKKINRQANRQTPCEGRH